MSSVNPSFNHLAISVPDAEAAVKWYTDVFGFRVVQEVTLQTAKDPSFNTNVRAIYGKELKAFKLAVLNTGNDVGLELFEFIDPPYRGPKERVDWNPETYTLGGIFHFCFTHPDVDGMAKKAIAAGARQVGDIIETVPGSKTVYLQDPWGNTFEFLSDTLAHFFYRIRKQG